MRLQATCTGSGRGSESSVLEPFWGVAISVPGAPNPRLAKFRPVTFLMYFRGQRLGAQSRSQAAWARDSGHTMVVVGTHFTFVLIVVYWEFPT